MAENIQMQDLEPGKQTGTNDNNRREEKRTYDDPEDQIWSVYNRETDKIDRALVERWKGDMDGLLIFAGLFSAVITAFIIESYKTLQVDSGDATVALLTQISLQLAASANGSQPSLPSQAVADIASFSPTSSSVRVNMCWFLSLTLSLATALAATLVQQWSRHYLQAIQRREIPRIRARIRCFLYDGVEQFQMSAFVEAVPALLHVAVFLFLGGLVEFLLPLDLTISYVILGAVSACGGLYATASISPVFLRHCPYRSPLTAGLWFLYRPLYLLYDPANTDEEERDQRDHKRKSFLDAQEKDALLLRTQWPQREAEALKWTLDSLTDHSELHPFIEGIPGYLDSHFIGERFSRMKCLKEFFADGTMVSRMENMLKYCRRSTPSPLQTQRALAILKVAFLLVRYEIDAPLGYRALLKEIDNWCSGDVIDPLVRHRARLLLILSRPVAHRDYASRDIYKTRHYYWKGSLALRTDEAQQALADIQDSDFCATARERDVAGLAIIIHVGYLLAQPQTLDYDMSREVLDHLLKRRYDARGGQTKWTPKVDHLLVSFCARLAGLEPDTLAEGPDAKVEIPVWVEYEIVGWLLNPRHLVEGEYSRAITILKRGKFDPALSRAVKYTL